VVDLHEALVQNVAMPVILRISALIISKCPASWLSSKVSNSRNNDNKKRHKLPSCRNSSRPLKKGAARRKSENSVVSRRSNERKQREEKKKSGS